MKYPYIVLESDDSRVVAKSPTRAVIEGRSQDAMGAPTWIEVSKIDLDGPSKPIELSVIDHAFLALIEKLAVISREQSKASMELGDRLHGGGHL